MARAPFLDFCCCCCRQRHVFYNMAAFWFYMCDQNGVLPSNHLMPLRLLRCLGCGARSTFIHVFIYYCDAMRIHFVVFSSRLNKIHWLVMRLLMLVLFDVCRMPTNFSTQWNDGWPDIHRVYNKLRYNRVGKPELRLFNMLAFGSYGGIREIYMRYRCISFESVASHGRYLLHTFRIFAYTIKQFRNKNVHLFHTIQSPSTPGQRWHVAPRAIKMERHFSLSEKNWIWNFPLSSDQNGIFMYTRIFDRVMHWHCAGEYIDMDNISDRLSIDFIDDLHIIVYYLIYGQFRLPMNMLNGISPLAATKILNSIDHHWQ